MEQVKTALPVASHAPVAIFVEDLGGGGAEKISVTLANGLSARGLPVDFFMWRAEGPFLAELDPAVRQINLSATRSVGIVDVVKVLRRYFRDSPPRIFLPQLEKPSLVAILAARLAGYRAVVPCVHIDLLRYMQHGHSLRRVVLAGLVAFFYRFVPSVVAVSKGAAESTQLLLWPKKQGINVIYNGFDFNKLRQDAAIEVEAGWLRDKTVPVIVACGRLVPQKAYDVLLNAFSHVRQQMAARLIILGEGVLRPGLEEQVKRLGLTDVVQMPGFVANPAAWFAKSDLFVLSSRNEGLSNVLIEALVLDVPVVSTDCPSGPREVLADGRYGRLVEVNDPEMLAQNIIQALQKPPEQATNERGQYLERFSATGMIEKYLEVINNFSRDTRAT